MVTTRSGSDTNLVRQNDGEEVDPHTRRVCSGGVSYDPQEQFDDCYNEEYRKLAAIPWFNRLAVIASADDGYERLMLYALDRRFSWYVTGEALRSRAWKDVYGVDSVDFRTGLPSLKSGCYISKMCVGVWILVCCQVNRLTRNWIWTCRPTLRTVRLTMWLHWLLCRKNRWGSGMAAFASALT